VTEHLPTTLAAPETPLPAPERGPYRQNSQSALRWARVTLVVIVAGLIGVIALPDRGSRPAPSDADSFSAVLASLRHALASYRIDHGEWPGWEPQAERPRPACAEWLVRQLTLPSDQAGETAAEPSPEHRFGPYLRGGIPANPVNGLATIRVLGEAEAWPLTADDRTGWIYDARSGLLKMNSQGAIEGSRVRYFDW
jgi:hypothetical protein